MYERKLHFERCGWPIPVGMREQLDLLSSVEVVQVMGFLTLLLNGLRVSEYGYEKISFLEVFRSIGVYGLSRVECLWYSEVVHEILCGIIEKKNELFHKKVKRDVSDQVRRKGGRSSGGFRR